MADCRGDAVDHCCYLGRRHGGVCSYLRDDGPLVVGRRWVCTLREELGSWDAVHTDPRWVADVAPAYDVMPNVGGCGDWPTADVTCAVCGVTG